MKKFGCELHIKSGKKHIAIELSTIIRLLASSNYTLIFTIDKKLAIVGTLEKTLSIIDDFSFVHVHRSHAVNKNKILSVDGQIISLTNGQTVPVSRRKKKLVMEAINAK